MVEIQQGQIAPLHPFFATPPACALEAIFFVMISHHPLRVFGRDDAVCPYVIEHQIDTDPKTTLLDLFNEFLELIIGTARLVRVGISRIDVHWIGRSIGTEADANTRACSLWDMDKQKVMIPFKRAPRWTPSTTRARG